MKKWLQRILFTLALVPRVLLGLFTVVMIIVVAAVLFANRPHVPDRAVLVIDPKGPLVEELAVPNPSDFLLGSARPSQASVHELIEALRRAKQDARIRLVYLKLGDMAATPLPILQELRHAIVAFRSSGKRVVAYADIYTQGEYYLASAADEVWLHPMGLVGITGLAYRRHYVKDALDKLHVDVQLFRAGKYKSFGEPFIRNAMSDAAREESQVWLDSLWGSYKQDVAASRGIKPAALQALVDRPADAVRASGNIAKAALKGGLVDLLLSDEQARERLGSMLNTGPDEKPPSIDFHTYLTASSDLAPAHKKENVGIIVASGEILSGEQPPGTVGSQSLAELLFAARTDPSVKAVVLRIDSPGGSALASEDIRQAILRLKESGKPLVVSMSGAAASGGYWIAADADEIWAYPTTLTGSIGVFGLWGDASKGLETLGIRTDGVATSPIAGHPRPDLPLPESLGHIFQMGVDDVYGQFLQVVSKGRKLDIEMVKALAQGRVWSGDEAVRLGLVDHLGGLDQAVRAAARRAGIEDVYGTRWLRKPTGISELIFERLAGEEARLLGPATPLLQRMATGLEPMARMLAHRGVYAWVDLDVE